MAGVDFVNQIAKDFGTDGTVPDDMKIVTLAKDHCPSWVWQCTAYVTVHDGRLDGVSLYTGGRNAMTTVTRDLIAKYGKPTRVSGATVTPDTGNPFKINEPAWSLPGLRVSYDVVLRNDEGDERIRTNEGIVRIMTEAEYQRRLAKDKKPAKSKL